MFPFAFHENFELGGMGGFNTETDTDNRLDFPGPQQFARDQMAVFPHRGGYCMRVNLGKGGTNPGYVAKTVTWAADSTNHIRFDLMIGEDVQFGNDGDVVDLMTLRSASADEGAICLARIEPSGLVLGVRDAAGAVLHYLSVEPGDWMCIEAEIHVDAGGADDGSIIVRVANDQLQFAGIDQAALTEIRFGSVAQDSGTDVKGNVYFDEILFDEARLYADMGAHNLRLDGETMPMFKTGLVFVGAGEIVGCQLIDGGSGDCVLKVYDTDDIQFAEHNLQEYLAATVANETVASQPLGSRGVLFTVQRGCYAELTGTDPQALIRMGNVGSFGEFDEDDDDEG